MSTHNPFEEFGKDIADALGPAPQAPASVEQSNLLHRMERDYRRRRRQRIAVGTASLALLLGLGLTWILLPTKSPDLELRRVGGEVVALGEWLSPKGEAIVLKSTDGSALTLEGGSHVRISHLDKTSIRVALEAGRLRAYIEPRKAHRWLFRAGPYEVEVVGTQLSIDWEAQGGALAVKVGKGAVRVRGDHLGDNGMMVRAGQRLNATLADQRVSITPVDAPASLPSADAAVMADATPREAPDLGAGPPRRTSRPLSMRWRTFARAGDYRKAVREARQVGVSRLLSRLNAAGLMLLADTGRLGGDRALAERAYGALRRRFKSTIQGRRAAFRLGRLHYEQHRAYKRAALWFGRYLREAPKGALVADARGRQMMALQRAGKLAEARKVAQRYLRLHPGGAYASSARALVSR
ncbi:MAG: FecR domain-containing protein [Deltaproteobacteria bacterium]|nr:FecR domain-containing protein [Deltaproteobacteria bacterium]